MPGKHIYRILIHLLFWALFIFISLFVFSDYYWKENPFLQYFTILLALVYLNDFILLPFFVRRKMYALYVLLIGVVAFFATQLYCNFFAECGCSVPKCLSNYLWQTLVPLIFFSFLWVLFRNLENQEEMLRIRKERTEMELQYLKSQINPHVLFNNLNTIYSYSLENPKQVPEMILMLSDNLKYVLYDSDSNKVLLEKEMEYIDNYIRFQKIRTENIKEIQYEKEIEDQGYSIAPLLLIAIIENAFKHSAANSTVDIQIRVKDGILECLCTNISKIKDESGTTTSIGLENLQKRLNLLYRDKYELSVEATEVYKVKLRLNLL
ncbi:MAG: histidine kinase [Bacteroidota bacterium]